MIPIKFIGINIRKRRIFIYSLFPFILLTGLKFQQEVIPEFRLLFNQQISSSCKGVDELIFEKSVTKGNNIVTRKYRIDCGWAAAFDFESGEKAELSLETEFSYLFEVYFNDPLQREHFDISHEENNWKVVRKSDHKSKTPLVLQTFTFYPGSKVLKSAYASIFRTSMLYDFSVSTTVNFDKVGNYQDHNISTRTNVIGGGETKTLIEGRFISQ